MKVTQFSKTILGFKHKNRTERNIEKIEYSLKPRKQSSRKMGIREYRQMKKIPKNKSCNRHDEKENYSFLENVMGTTESRTIKRIIVALYKLKNASSWMKEI